MDGGTITNTSILTTRPNQKAKAPDACVLCLESISERAIAVPCNHCDFDFICLASWLQDNTSCPLCKTELTALEYDWRAPNDFKTYRVRRPNNNRSTAHATGDRQFSGPPYYYHLRQANRINAHPVISLDKVISRRRQVYRHQLFSLHVGSNRVSRFKDFTPQMVSRSQELQSRARKWIRRELQVFEFLSSDVALHTASQVRRRANNAEFLLEYIVAILRTVDVKDSSGKAEEKLQDFLGADNARLFLHELSAWLRSPYDDLQIWDRHVRYASDLQDLTSSTRGGHSLEPA